MNDSEFKDNFRNKKSYGNHVECLQHHLSNYFSDEEMTVFHEILSMDFHVDVYFIKPKDRDYNLLLTSGMSAFSMTVDEGIPNPGDYQFAEVMVLLPKKLDFGD